MIDWLEGYCGFYSAIAKDLGDRVFKPNLINDVLTVFSSSHFSMHNLVWRVMG